MAVQVPMDNIILQAGIVNENLLFTTTPDATSLQYESIEYVVIPNPAMLITTAGAALYNIACCFKLNYVFTYPLNNTFTKDLSKMKG